MIVIYNWKLNKIILISAVMVIEIEDMVNIANYCGIWFERPELVIVGEL